MCEFDGSERHYKELYSIIEQGNPEQRRKLDALLSDGSKSGFKPLVLLPGLMESCGKVVVRCVCEMVVYYVIDVVHAI